MSSMNSWKLAARTPAWPSEQNYGTRNEAVICDENVAPSRPHHFGPIDRKPQRFGWIDLELEIEAPA